MVVMSSHWLDLSVLQGIKTGMKEGPVSSVSHRTAVLTLREGALARCHWSADKGKGFFARLWMSPLSQASPKCSVTKASTAEGTRQLRHTNEYQRTKNTVLLFHYYWSAAKCGQDAPVRAVPIWGMNRQLQLPWLLRFSPQGNTGLFSGRQETSKVSTPHKDKRGITPLCVCTHMFIYDVHADTDLWFLSSSSFVSSSSVSLSAPQSPLFGCYQKPLALIKL